MDEQRLKRRYENPTSDYDQESPQNDNKNSLLEEKEKRLCAIREIIETESVYSQRQMCALLADMGLNTTQATVSRYIGELGLRKMDDGSYATPKEATLMNALKAYGVDVEHVDTFCVVHVKRSSPLLVLDAIESMGFPGVSTAVPSVESVVVLCRSEQDAAEVALHLQNYFNRANCRSGNK